MLDRDEGQSFKNLGYNFIGWQVNADTDRKAINILKMPFVIFFNLLMLVPNLARNILKLVTELLPALMFALFSEAADAMSEQRRCNSNPFIRSVAAIGYVAAMAGFFLGKVLYFVGRAISSAPFGVLCAWRDGKKAGKLIANKFQLGETSEKILTYGFGGALAGLSAALTFTIYFVCLPIAIKVAAANVLPHVAGVLPHFVTQTAATLGNVATPVLSAIGNSVVMPVLGKLFIGLGVSPASAGFGLVAGLLTPTIGPAAYRPIERFKLYWHKSANSSENKNLATIVDEYRPSAATKPVLTSTHATASNRLRHRSVPIAPNQSGSSLPVVEIDEIETDSEHGSERKMAFDLGGSGQERMALSPR